MKLMPEKMNDLELIDEVLSHGDSSCFREIVNRHSGIYLQMVHNYAPRETSIDNFNDLIDSRESHIYDAVRSFDANRKIKFSTYLGNHTRWLCLTAANKRRHVAMEDGFDCAVENDETKEVSDQKVLKEIFEQLSCLEDKRIEKIFRMRYMQGGKKLTPWRKIAKELDLSIQGCINIHNMAFNALWKNVQKNYD
jgi:DNA-directed RNA polymerase specialized sigma subunit